MVGEWEIGRDEEINSWSKSSGLETVIVFPSDLLISSTLPSTQQSHESTSCRRFKVWTHIPVWVFRNWISTTVPRRIMSATSIMLATTRQDRQQWTSPTNYVRYTPIKSAFHLLTSIVSIAPSSSVLDLLRPDYVQDALYNSAKRSAEHAVICQPDTQDKILRAVRFWADSKTSPVCWLSGPAGTGKTTIAHTIAREYDNCGQLAATFFL